MKRRRPLLYARPPTWPALMTRDVLCAYLGDISRQLLSRWQSAADFPQPVTIRGVSRWSRTAIDSWIENLSMTPTSSVRARRTPPAARNDRSRLRADRAIDLLLRGTADAERAGPA